MSNSQKKKGFGFFSSFGDNDRKKSKIKEAKKVEIKMSKLDKVKEKVKLLAERNGLLPQCETPEQLHKRKESAKKLESLMSNFDLTIKAMHEDE